MASFLKDADRNNSNKINFTKRIWRIAQVLYRRGLFKEGVAQFPSALARVPFIQEKRKPVSKLELASKLRQAFEDLGPTFIKLGQALSTRPDMVSREVVEELALLRDQVQPFAREEVDKQVTAELGALPHCLFKDFDYTPLASASIAQVHRATLLTGEQVVLKIQRPMLGEDIKQDIGVLQFLEPFLQRTILGKVCNLNQVVDAFSRQIRKELDFTLEALNLQSFAQVLDPKHQIQVPGVYWNCTTKKVLTIDYMEGKNIEDFLNSNPSKGERQKIAQKLVVAVMEPFFQHGVFHGDPHQGNLLVTDKSQLVVLDYGIVGHLDQEFRFQVALLLVAFKNFDTMGMTEVIRTLGEVTKPLNNHLFYEDASQLMDLVRGVNQGEVTFSKVIYGMIDMAINHGILLPASFYLFGKALVTTEAVVRELDEEISLVDEIHPLAREYQEQEFKLNSHQDKLKLASLTALREQRHVPGRVAAMLTNMSEGKQQLIFSHRGLEPLAAAVKDSGQRVWSALVIVGLLVSGAIAISFGSDGLQLALGGVGLGLAGMLILKNLLN